MSHPTRTTSRLRTLQLSRKAVPNRDRPAQDPLSRRHVLQRVAAVGLSAVLPRVGHSVDRDPDEGRAAWHAAILSYLSGLWRPDGGYAWDDQPRSHLTPTFAAIGCHALLGSTPSDAERLAEFVRTHHPTRWKKLEQEHREFEYQQIQSLLWLGADASGFHDLVRSWGLPVPYLKQYEQHQYPVFRFQLTAFTCRALLELPLDDLSPEFLEYLSSRRRANGSFNNTPAADGGDGHALNTWWGLEALHALQRETELRQETVEWLRACQRPGGGFTWRPEPEFAGLEDVAYTWAAVRGLTLLGAQPGDPDATVRWLWSLRNDDGGCGDRPGWASNALATYRAIDALRALNALDAGPSTARRAATLRPATTSAPVRDDLKVFTIQIEAHGRGSPAEAVDLARALRIHLWGAKNARPEWIARAQQIADRQGVPVTFFVSDEEYGTWVDVPGLGTYSHTSDLTAPAGASIGPSLAAAGVVSWPEFRERRLAPLRAGAGRLIWQFGENEELVRLFLDDSLERGGYAAISTFHFGNPDFTNSEPFLNRYRGLLPFVALQDAHGNEPWWFADMTTGFRTLLLAREPTWEGWLDALRRQHVVAVRRDALTSFETLMHGPSREVIDFVRAHERDWRWWDNPDIERPPISLVALRPEDEFETGRPERGVALRVRCAWENTTQGQPKQPLAELESLTVDGTAVSPALHTQPRRNGTGLEDHYHIWPLPDAAAGRHTATATVRVKGTGARVSRTIEFVV
jgi:prenyltransferase beta subunit